MYILSLDYAQPQLARLNVNAREPRGPCWGHIEGEWGRGEGIRNSYEQPWSSGMMLACHAGDPGSIPGGCTFSTFNESHLSRKGRTSLLPP